MIGYNVIGYNVIGYNVIGYNVIGYNVIGYNVIGYNVIGYNDMIQYNTIIKETTQTPVYHGIDNVNNLKRRSM